MGKFLVHLSIFFIASLSLSFAQTPLVTQQKGLEKANSRGYCGDGMINGNEDCDGQDIKIRSCKVLNGGEGNVKCQPNCVYDISECGTGQQLSDAIDQRVGGIYEVCKCDCASDNTVGDCVNDQLGMTMVDCMFRSDNNCTCRCEGKLQAHLEYCNLSCKCAADRSSGKPQCSCHLDQCEMLVGTSPNIGQLATRKPRFPFDLPSAIPSLDPYTHGPFIPPPPHPNDSEDENKKNI